MTSPKFADNTVHAVLTGDLVGSTKLSPAALGSVRASVEAAAADISTWGCEVAGPQFFRGDSWQLAISEPRYFLRAAIRVRAGLASPELSVDTRIGVGLGRIETLVRKEVSESTGAAFVRSGEALDGLKRRNAIEVFMTDEMRETTSWLPTIIELTDFIAQRWKPGQAKVALAAFAPADSQIQAEVAETLQLTQQAVSKALVTSGADRVMEACRLVESIAWESRL